MIRTREWWQSRSPEFLDSCARTLSERIGRDGFSAIALCGSFALGDESIVLENDPPLLLSDVDLVVVASSRAAHAAWGGRRAELGAACETALPEVRFEGRVDVGVMLSDDLRALPPRPGVYDLREAGRVLAGDRNVLGLVPAYRPDDLSAAEAAILVENRAAALLAFAPEIREPGGGAPYRLLYEIARAYTDIGAAALAIAGEYVPGYAARAEALAAKRAGTPLLERLVEPDLAERVASWTRFKLEPRLAGVPGAEGAWERAADDLLRFWRRAAAVALFGREAAARRIPSRRLAGRISAARGARDRLRGWRGLFRETPPSSAAGIAAGLGARIAACAPLDVVRGHAVLLLESRLAGGAGAPVPPAPGGFPYRSRRWDEAAREVVARWRGIVFGRREG